MISKKTLCSKDFTSNLRNILHENNRSYNSCRFSYKFAFIPFLSFLANHTQESGFQQVGVIASRALLQSHAEFNKGIFIHVIPVRIIVPCTNIFLETYSNFSVSFIGYDFQFVEFLYYLSRGSTVYLLQKSC